VTKLLENICAQPGELGKSLSHSFGPGRDALKQAAELIADARQIYITGIGSSWHAGMAVASLFEYEGVPVLLKDASELLHFARLPEQSALIILSRSGMSVEVVSLVENAEAAGATVIGVTNTPDSRLATRADVTLRVEAAFDHHISVTMYSALALVGGLLAAAVTGTLTDRLHRDLQKALEDAQKALGPWQKRLQGHPWFAQEASAYFLARGGSLASAHEARMLWEEGAKAPASVLSTGGFRHGSQEIVRPDLRVALWLDVARMRHEDLALAADLRHRGVKVALIGQNLPGDAADLVFEVPAAPDRWQFLTDVIPAQLAAEYLARLRGVDCDNLKYRPYIIDSEGGLSYPGLARRG